jgi:site-specific DNA-methyltransferase (adenine-specific)
MRPGTSLAGSVTEVFNGGGREPIDGGRWPPNILLSHTPDCGESCTDDCPVAEMDDQGGGASRFFPVFKYQAKASKKDRGTGNIHPTVKPVELMRWLVRLVTPPGGVVLEPFMGSGTTGVAARLEGFGFIGIEREPQYFEISSKRIESVAEVKDAQEQLFA